MNSTSAAEMSTHEVSPAFTLPPPVVNVTTERLPPVDDGDVSTAARTPEQRLHEVTHVSDARVAPPTAPRSSNQSSRYPASRTLCSSRPTSARRWRTRTTMVLRADSRGAAAGLEVALRHLVGVHDGREAVDEQLDHRPGPGGQVDPAVADAQQAVVVEPRPLAGTGRVGAACGRGPATRRGRGAGGPSPRGRPSPPGARRRRSPAGSGAGRRWRGRPGGGLRWASARGGPRRWTWRRSPTRRARRTRC